MKLSADSIALDSSRDALLRFGAGISRERLFPTIVPEAAVFALKNSFAFALACSLDRQSNSEVIWTIPYDLRTLLGHLDPCLLRQTSMDDVSKLVQRMPRKPRYVNDAPRTIHELSVLVCETFAGDAANIWRGRSAAEVRNTFLSIYGVGPGIANMTVLLIEKAFEVRFPDRSAMDIKPDTHTMRVLYRLGAARAQTEIAAIQAAQQLNPSFPGALDAPLWMIGREFCRPFVPDCGGCPLRAGCQRVGL